MHCQVPVSVRLIFTQYSPLQKGVSVIVLCTFNSPFLSCRMIPSYCSLLYVYTVVSLSCRPGDHYERRPTPASLHGCPAICGYRWIIIFGFYAFSHRSSRTLHFTSSVIVCRCLRDSVVLRRFTSFPNPHTSVVDISQSPDASHWFCDCEQVV